MAANAKGVSRRGFLKVSAGVGAAAIMGAGRMTARSYGQVVGANEAIRLAVVGCGDMGGSQINQFKKIAGVRIVGLCDADQAALDRRMTLVTAGGGAAVPTYRDVRKLLESKEIDAISVATPNHWHSLITVWACQAGKDVYVEKPICHNIWEGGQAVAASRKYDRIVQAGMQWRSMAPVYETFEYAKGGNLGKILVSRGLCYKRRDTIGKTEGPQPVAATVDYDLWCGPAPKDPLRRTKLHYDWHWVWPTGNGDIGNQGAHQMDLARWALGKSTVAPSVISTGGRLGYVDDGQTPNEMMTVHDYGDSLLIFEVRGLPTKTGAGTTMDLYKGANVGNVVECEGGYVTVTQALCAAYDKEGKEIKRFTGENVKRDRNHPENFLKAVRSRKREEQNGEIVEGHVSSSLSHLSNISYRLGVGADQDAIKEALKSQPAAVETLARMEAHLAANDIKLDVEKLALGVPLQVDTASMKIVGNEKASVLLTREYREPFVVPMAV